MTYKSKRTIFSILGTVAVFSWYFIYTLDKYTFAYENLKPWASTTLIFIGIAIGAQIIIQILFHIGLSIGIAIKEKEPDDKKIERYINSAAYEDEMDKLINLKAIQVYMVCVSSGFILALIGLAFLNIEILFAMYIILSSFLIGSLIDSFIKIYFYERGIHNG